MVDRLKTQYQGKVDIRTLKVDSNQEAYKLLDQLGGTGVPEFYFIGTDGTLVNKIIGPADENTFKGYLDALK